MLGFTPEEQWALTLTTFAGLSTSIGALIAVLRRPDDSMLAFLLGTAIGVMGILSVAEMWLHNAIETHNWPGVTAAFLCGALLYQVVSPFIPTFEPTDITGGGGGTSSAAEVDDDPTTAAYSSLVFHHHSNQKSRSRFLGGGGGGGGSGGGGGAGSDSGSSPRMNGNGGIMPGYKPGLVPRRGDSGTLEQTEQGRMTVEMVMRGGDGGGDALGVCVDSSSPPATTSINASTINGKDNDNDTDKPAGARRSAELLRLGFLMAVTMTLHNAPEGFAVAFSSFTDFGPIMAAAIAVHNIPEGYIISLPLFLSTGSRWKAIAIATLSGLSEPAGALIALLLGRPLLTQDRIHYVLAFVGGIMSAVSVLELWPEGRKCKSDDKMQWGLCVGGMVMGWTLWMGI